MKAIRNQPQQGEHRTECTPPCPQGGKCQVPKTSEQTAQEAAGEDLWMVQISRKFMKNIRNLTCCINQQEPLWNHFLAARQMKVREPERKERKRTSMQGSTAGANRHPGCSASQQKCRPERCPNLQILCYSQGKTVEVHGCAHPPLFIDITLVGKAVA